MRFTLVDRILELEPGRRIVTVKNLTMAEEYLAEHFPAFPVMPGVLMVEAITQAGAWLIRVTEQFASSIIVLKEVKMVRFGHFVAPGRQLRLTCEWTDDDGRLTTFKARGDLDGQTSVSGRVVLERFNLAERHPHYARQDRRLRAHHKRAFEVVTDPVMREQLSMASAKMKVAAS